jgi:hypothetical protein
LPLARNTLSFGVVIAMLQMACGVPGTIRHSANRKHLYLLQPRFADPDTIPNAAR